MTRQYAALRLLEHGALTFAQFSAITGWGEKSARGVLWNLQQLGLVTSPKAGYVRHWVLAA